MKNYKIIDNFSGDFINLDVSLSGKKLEIEVGNENSTASAYDFPDSYCIDLTTRQVTKLRDKLNEFLAKENKNNVD